MKNHDIANTYDSYTSDDGDGRLSKYGQSRPTVPALLPLTIFGIVAVLMGLDVILDALSGAMPSHVVVEILLTALALFGASIFFRQWVQERALSRARAEALRQRDEALHAAIGDVERWQTEARKWRREAQDAVRGLATHIDQQFDRWTLTPAEREVALLILKGLSHKEIASVRDVSDRTVRDQARAVYRKGGLSGRAELSAFFLEDLLLPSSWRESQPVQ